jgi:transposase-like protein
MIREEHERRTATMADDLRMALTNLLRNAEMAGDVDFLRDGVRILGQTLMDLEVSQHLRAEKNERTPEKERARFATPPSRHAICGDATSSTVLLLQS